VPANAVALDDDIKRLELLLELRGARFAREAYQEQSRKRLADFDGHIARIEADLKVLGGVPS